MIVLFDINLMSQCFCFQLISFQLLKIIYNNFMFFLRFFPHLLVVFCFFFFLLPLWSLNITTERIFDHLTTCISMASFNFTLKFRCKNENLFQIYLIQDNFGNIFKEETILQFNKMYGCFLRFISNPLNCVFRKRT